MQLERTERNFDKPQNASAQLYESAYDSPFTSKTSRSNVDAEQVLAGDSDQEGGLSNVFSLIGEGMGEELDDNLGNVAAHAAIGIGVAAGMAMLSAPLAIGVAAAAAIWGAIELIDAIPDWWHDASVAYDPESHSAVEVSESEEGLRTLGAGSVDFVAAGVGAGVGSMVGRVLAAPAREIGSEAMSAVNARMSQVADSAIVQEGRTVLTQGAETLRGAASRVWERAIPNPTAREKIATAFSEANAASSKVDKMVSNIGNRLRTDYAKLGAQHLPITERVATQGLSVLANGPDRTEA